MPRSAGGQQRKAGSRADAGGPGPEERAAELFGWHGVVVHGVPLLGQWVSVVAEIDDGEHRRRLTAGCGAVLDYAVLDELGNLPQQVPVPIGAEHERCGSGSLGTVGAVEVHGGSVTRLARRPCRVVGELRRGGPWLDTIEQMSLLAPLTARAVILPEQTADHGAAALEAASLGVGLARCDDAGGLRVEAFPKPTTARLSTGHWLMTEAVYATWLQG